ncbi:helicase HerA domain-containing protein [Enterovibrio norvegicus]|uniref:helicase HerA domain-containing protein n=1 Tax=Enterovibrio norvegicus TaxID=188144 RepID=UPI0030364099
MQPKNPNNALSNHHVCVVGMSESGKTSAAKKLFIERGDQVLIFDPYGDYTEKLGGQQVQTFGRLADLAKAVFSARKKTAGFKYAYKPARKTSPDDLNAFCKLAWAAGDGQHKKLLKVLLEEVAEHSKSAGKADGYHGEILRVGRKFGIASINLFQRGQEVSKTIFDNCKYACVMMQKTSSSAKYLADKTGIPFEVIDKLEKLEYVYQSGKTYETGKITF